MEATQAVIERVRGEFAEMPGLRLTMAQVQRLCGVETSLCEPVLDALVVARFLCVKPDGCFARLTDGAIQGPHPAKARGIFALPRGEDH